MSQHGFTNFDASERRGQDLSSIFDALHSSHLGATRPALAPEGMLWSKMTTYTPAGMGSVDVVDPSFSVGAADVLLMPRLDVRSVGVSPSNTATQNSDALDKAIAIAALSKRSLYFPAGEYNLIRKPLFKSGLVMVDPTFGGAELRLDDAADDDESILCGPMLGDADMARVDDVTVVGFTLNGNHGRSPDIGDLRPGGACAAAGYIHNWKFYRTKAHGGKLHGFDICNGGELNSGGDRVYSDGDNTHPSSLRSSRVHLYECESWDCGDDTFTVHAADDWKIYACKAWGSSGRHPSLNGAVMFEIDDCTGPGLVAFCECFGPSNTGFAVKCHDGYPAPYGVTVAFNKASGVARGFYANDPNAGGPSPSAKDVSFIGNEVRKPAFYDKPTGEKSDTDIVGFSFGEYKGLIVQGNKAIGDGLFVVETALNGGSLDRQTESAFEFENGCQFVATGNLAQDWASDNTTDAGVGAFKVTSSCVGILSNNVSIDCGKRGFVDTGGNTNSVLMGNLAILSASVSADDDIAFRVSTHGDETPDGIMGNRAHGPWHFALSVSENDYVKMRDFTGVGNENSAFSVERQTDLLMNTATETNLGATAGFNAVGFAEFHDLNDDFTSATGTFLARHQGRYNFNAQVVFSEGDGDDDSCNLLFLVTSADGLTTSERAKITINPRKNSGAGVEDTETIMASITLDRGQSVNLRFQGMVSDTPVIAKAIYFEGEMV